LTFFKKLCKLKVTSTLQTTTISNNTFVSSLGSTKELTDEVYTKSSTTSTPIALSTLEISLIAVSALLTGLILGSLFVYFKCKAKGNKVKQAPLDKNSFQMKQKINA
jgi:hypothetical protein